MYIKGTSPSMQADSIPSSVTAETAPGLAIKNSSTSDDREASPVDCPFSGKRLKSVVVEVSKSASSSRTQDHDGDVFTKDENLSDKVQGVENEAKLIDTPDSIVNKSVKNPKVKVQAGNDKGNT